MCSEGADLKSLGRCTLELIVARGEIEQNTEGERSKALGRIRELEQSVIYFSSRSYGKKN
jgi:hypothetical protein